MLRSLAQWLRQLGVAFLIFLVTTYGVLVAASLPRTVKVYVLGVENVPQSEVSMPLGTTFSLVLTRSIEGEPLKFRNENTGRSWPPYFKFNASQLEDQVLALSQGAIGVAGNEAPELVALRYYGFRLGISATYPNVVTLSPAVPGPLPVPYFNWAILILHGLGAMGLVWALRSRRRRLHTEEGVSAYEEATEHE